MKNLNRRQFIRSSLAAGAVLASPLSKSARGQRCDPPGGHRRRVQRQDRRHGQKGNRRVPAHPRRPHHGPVRLRQRQSHAAGQQAPREGPERQGVRRHAQAARRQERRRRHRHHAQSLARAGDDLGVPGRQGRVRAEADGTHDLRGPADGRGGPQVQSHRAGPARPARADRICGGPGVRPPGQPRQGPLRARRSTTSPGRASGKSPARSRSRSP